MIAKEKLACTKMKPICELEGSHGVNLGVGYKNNFACAMFISFIAKEQKNCLLNSLSKTCFFFSLQANASVDAGNVELRVIFNNLF